jgi:hypothetical protein
MFRTFQRPEMEAKKGPGTRLNRYQEKKLEIRK